MNNVCSQDPSHCLGLLALWTLARLEEAKPQPLAQARATCARVREPTVPALPCFLLSTCLCLSYKGPSPFSEV